MKKLTSKNRALEEALRAKINQILLNPHHFKPLGNVMKGMRRVHIMGCYVLSYDIDEAEQRVILRKFSHHDEAY